MKTGEIWKLKNIICNKVGINYPNKKGLLKLASKIEILGFVNDDKVNCRNLENTNENYIPRKMIVENYYRMCKNND